jgi:hypothetical protein
MTNVNKISVGITELKRPPATFGLKGNFSIGIEYKDLYVINLKVCMLAFVVCLRYYPVMYLGKTRKCGTPTLI